MAKRYFSMLSSGATCAALAGCSLLNSFGEVSDFSDGGGAGGATDTGGSGNNTGGTDLGGQGGEPGVALPGLVVVAGDADGDLLTSDPVLVALSPQTGEELARLEGAYDAAVHEAERDIWFLVQGNKVRAQRFDRTRDRWEALGKETTVVAPTSASKVFALNGTLSILASGEISVFDTKDLDAIKLVDTTSYPDTTVWGTVGAPSQLGGAIHVLSVNCAGVTNCEIELTRIQVSRTSVSTSTPTLVDTMSVTSTDAQGSIAFDGEVNDLVLVIPDLAGTESGTTTLRTFIAANYQADKSYPLTQFKRKEPFVAFDTCDDVAYVMVPFLLPMTAAGLTNAAERTEMSKTVGVNGQGLLLEPYTRSLILLQKSGDAYSIDAWSMTGTTNAPDIKKRLGNWQPSSVRPDFATVALPSQVVCE